MNQCYIAYRCFEIEAIWWHGGIREAAESAALDWRSWPIMCCPRAQARDADDAGYGAGGADGVERVNRRDVQTGITNPFRGFELARVSAKAMSAAVDGLSMRGPASRKAAPLVDFTRLKIFPGRYRVGAYCFASRNFLSLHNHHQHHPTPPTISFQLQSE